MDSFESSFDNRKYKTNYEFYAKDEYGDDDTLNRNKKRNCYQGATIFLILFDVLVQFNLFTSMYCLYFFMSEDNFTKTFSIFGFDSPEKK
jgi:hypothetical protein